MQSNNPYDQSINKNQYLTGNPSTQSDANTVWMNPSDASKNTGISGGGGASNISQQQPNPPSQVSNGTMLGSIAAGNVGQYNPWGYDAGKFNDPNKHDPKYDVGRILSKYPPSTEGLQAAMAELGPLGYRMSGKDSIIGPDGVPIDVGFAFGSGQGSHWQWNPNDPNATQQGSMLGQQQQNPNNMLQQIWQAMQARRANFANQQFNPTGGFNPYMNNGAAPYQSPTGGISGNAQPSSMLGPMMTPPGYDYNTGGLGLPPGIIFGLSGSNNYDPRVQTQFGVAQ